MDRAPLSWLAKRGGRRRDRTGARRAGLALLGLSALLALGMSGLTSCAQTPPNVPVRTFERAERVDFLCMQVRDPEGVPVLPTPVPQAKCTPVPAEEVGSDLANNRPFHLYGLVTQTTRGELAVVDLTAGYVVDNDISTPGINFLPIGALPRDVATTPDGLLAFVTSGEPNKPALYAVPGHRILGDDQGGKYPRAQLTTWPVCALPEQPTSVAVVSAATGLTADPYSYQVVVLLPGTGGSSARLLTLDPKPFLRGADVKRADLPDGAKVDPGSLSPCPVTAALALGGAELVPSSAPIGPVWDDGVKYAAAPPPSGDAGAPVPPAVREAVPFSASCASPPSGADAGGPDSGTSDSGARTPSVPLEFDEPLGRSVGNTFVKDGTTVYVADAALPLIHVVDLSRPGAPRELPPLVASSISEPSRRVSVRDLAVSPPTRDYRRFLYAIDAKDGSIMVYDVTDPATSPRVPLTRPNPQSNPFEAQDRISFNAPVVSVAFARHEVPQQRVQAAKTGVLCNPNPNVGAGAGPFSDPGGYFRASVVGDSLGPFHLRGVFAFATLSNGQVITLDVDDWDAPCRRPDPMSQPPSATTPIQPNPEPPSTDTDPYHVPTAFKSGVDQASPVTLEAFFPVSAPNRSRSRFYLRNDPKLGNHVPNLGGSPQLFSNNAPLPTVGSGSDENPKMLAPRTALADPGSYKDPLEPDPKARVDLRNTSVVPTQDTLPGLRFSWEDPTVHVEQDWVTVFEGTLPGFAGLVATLSSSDDFKSLTLSREGARFCSRGVEDLALGQERARAVTAELARLKLSSVPDLDRRMVDYVELTDELLPPVPINDYWTVGQPSWAELNLVDSAARYNACKSYFGVQNDGNINRRFPILEAYDGRLVVGRYAQLQADGAACGANEHCASGLCEEEKKTEPARCVARKGASPSSARLVVVPAESSNTNILKLARACFHNQARFAVRAGGQWLTKGATTDKAPIQYLHHVARGQGDRCVQSCEPREQLLNARAPAVPRILQDGSGEVGANDVPERNSPLAMRNPMFSFIVWNGKRKQDSKLVDVEPTRDIGWRFTTKGSFGPLFVNLASSTLAVNPRSTRYIDALGQLAIVDGASQGLVLLDLSTVSLARTFF